MNMVEKVAKAIFEAAAKAAEDEDEYCSPEMASAAARAAVEAMREPTEEMVKAGANRHYGNDYMSPEDFDEQARVIYADMVASAIAGEVHVAESR